MPVFTLDLWSLLSLVGIVQGLFLTFTTARQPHNRPANRFLLLILGLLLWYQLEFLSVRTAFEVPSDLFYGARFGSWLALGPLIYLYVRALTEAPFEFRKNDLRHFLPFLLTALLIPLIFGNLLPERAINYGMLTILLFPKMGLNCWQVLYWVVFLSQFVHLGAYLLYTHRYIRNYGQRLNERFSKAIFQQVAWLKWLLLFMTILVAGAFVFLLMTPILNYYNRFWDYLYILPATVFNYVLAYKAIRQAPVFGIEPEVQKELRKYKKSALKAEQSGKILRSLLDLMAFEKLFLDPDLTLDGLAERLSVPSHYLSQVLNEQLGKNFFDFVNAYRVEEAKRLIREPDGVNKNLLQIGFAAGFNNKTSFINYFKKVTGLNPSQFVRREKNV